MERVFGFFTIALILLSVTHASADEKNAGSAFSWTGTYDGHYVCQEVSDGAPSSISRPANARIVQDGDALQAVLSTDIDRSGNSAYGIYRGAAMTDGTGTIGSGYLAVCGGSFSHLEIVSIYPASLDGQPYSFVADSIFVSRQTPGATGVLKVLTCRLHFSRKSTDAPDVAACTSPGGLDFTD